MQAGRARYLLPLGLIALLAVGGCRTVERDFEPPDPSAWVPRAGVRSHGPAAEVPPASPPETGGAEEGSFAVPPRAGAYPITLEQVLQLAGSEALTLRMLAEEARSVEAEEQVVLDSLLPTLHLTTEFTLADGQVQDTAGNFFDVDERQNAFFGPAARLSFDPAVAIYRADEASERSDASLHGLRAASNDVLRDAAFLYFDLVEAHAMVVIAQTSVTDYEGLVQLEEARFGSGASLESNLLRARARQARSSQNLVAAENRVATTSSALAELLRMEASIELAPSQELLETIHLVPSSDLDDLIAQGLERRPEVHQARSLFNSAREGGDFWRNRWMIPRLDLIAQYGGFGEDFGELEDNQYYEAGLTWDFAMTDRSETTRARALQRRARFAQEATVRAVSRQIVDACEAVESARAAIRSATVEVATTQEVYDLVLVRYERGAGEQVEVLWSELELTGAKVSLVRSLTWHNRAQYELLRAIGGPGV